MLPSMRSIFAPLASMFCAVEVDGAVDLLIVRVRARWRDGPLACAARWNASRRPFPSLSASACSSGANDAEVGQVHVEVTLEIVRRGEVGVAAEGEAAFRVDLDLAGLDDGVVVGDDDLRVHAVDLLALRLEVARGRRRACRRFSGRSRPARWRDGRRPCRRLSRCPRAVWSMPLAARRR